MLLSAADEALGVAGRRGPIGGGSARSRQVVEEALHVLLGQILGMALAVEENVLGRPVEVLGDGDVAHVATAQGVAEAVEQAWRLRSGVAGVGTGSQSCMAVSLTVLGLPDKKKLLSLAHVSYGRLRSTAPPLAKKAELRRHWLRRRGGAGQGPDYPAVLLLSGDFVIILH